MNSEVLRLHDVSLLTPAELQAYDMGAKGSPHSEQERALFEAYMRGHCWQFGEWDAKLGCYSDMGTRMLFGVWRDRAALAQQAVSPIPAMPL